MHAAPSHQKRPTKVPDLKSLRLIPSSHGHVKGFLSKFSVLKVDLLYDHQIYCKRTCICALFSPETLQAGAVKGLKRTLTVMRQYGTCAKFRFCRCEPVVTQRGSPRRTGFLLPTPAAHHTRCPHLQPTLVTHTYSPHL